MSDRLTTTPQELYEEFETHVVPNPTRANSSRCAYTGCVCHLNTDPQLPGHVVPFHADGDDAFRSPKGAMEEAVRMTRSIVDGTYSDLSVLSIMTHGYWR